MTVVPELDVHQYWEWVDDDGPYPYHMQVDTLPTLTETGTAVDTPLTGSDSDTDIPNGGNFDYSFDFSPNAQHFVEEATPPNYDPNPGEIFPGTTPDAGYTLVDVYLDAYFQDTMTNDSAGSVTLDFTYTLTLGAPFQGQLDTSGVEYEFGDAGGTIDFSHSGGQGTGSATITLAPHQSLDYILHYFFEGSAGWSWGTQFDPATQQYTLEPDPTQTLLVYEAPDTGRAAFTEVDSQGHVIPGNPDVSFASGIDFSAACFAAGTRILTSHGEVIIEAVRAGDRVATVLGGELRPVRRVAHRHVDLRGHRRPWDVMPVRVRAGAFGPGLPVRDLILSPDHAVFLQGSGNLTPVRYLLNGATVVQEGREAVTYWHIALDSQDVMLAEGLPAETYLDTGNRDAVGDDGGVGMMRSGAVTYPCATERRPIGS